MSKNIQKTAVDATAAAYWSKFFPSGYGTLLVRKIPLKIKAALEARLSASARKASAEGITVSLPVIEEIVPFAHSTDGKTHTFEGGIKASISGAARHFAFIATFNEAGEISDFESVAV